MAHELEQIIQTGHLQIAVPTHGITISQPVTEEMVHLARLVQKSDTTKNRNNLQQVCIAFRNKHRKEVIAALTAQEEQPTIRLTKQTTNYVQFEFSHHDEWTYQLVLNKNATVADLLEAYTCITGDEL